MPHQPALAGQIPAQHAKIVTTTSTTTTTTTSTTTTTPRPHIYSKYVCGVKGTLRSGRNPNALSLVSYTRAKYGVERQARQYVNELRRTSMANSTKTAASATNFHKSTERLILGSEIIPIQINNDKLGDLIQNEILSSNQLRSYTDHHKSSGMNNKLSAMANKSTTVTLPSSSNNSSSSSSSSVGSGAFAMLNTMDVASVNNMAYRNSSRHARVVGGEDGDNGEWCWQVALINSMNQYLCGAALIGTQWVLTAAHCVTK